MLDDRNTSTECTAVKCTYDHDKLLLRCPPLEVTLSSNEGHLLLALIEGATDKEDLISRVWGDRGLIVSDSSYYKALHTLRHYLSEVGLDRSILKTLPRRGVVLLLKIEKVSGETSSDDAPAPIEHDINVHEPDIVSSAHEAVPSPVHTFHLADIPDTPAVHADMINTSPESSIRRHLHRTAYALILLLGAALPLYYAYITFTRPVELEEWRVLWQSGNTQLHVELGEKSSKDDILASLSVFNASVGTTGVNYYVKKTLSELLISCEKPDSKGEALCTNYLIIEQKK